MDRVTVGGTLVCSMGPACTTPNSIVSLARIEDAAVYFAMV